MQRLHPSRGAPIKALPIDAFGRALMEIREERHRQKAREGFDYAHDDQHDGEQLLHAAQAYFWEATAPSAVPGGHMLCEEPYQDSDLTCLRTVPRIWPWESKWWKPGEPRRMLVKSGALCLAESERWYRLQDPQSALKADQLLCRVIFYILKTEVYDG